jgi:hypothetical protein
LQAFPSRCWQGLVSRVTVIKEDASLAAFYLVSLAVGVTIVSMRGTNIDLLHVLFGNILALDDQTLLVIAFNATITLVVMAVIYRPLVIECVDPVFLRTVSRAGAPAHLAFLALVVVNLVNGFHALGTLLAVGLMILPAGIARFWSRDITGMMMIDAYAKSKFETIPEDHRKVLTSHDAFGYFGREYHVGFLSPLGVSTESEASAADVAKLIEQIKAEHVKTYFFENSNDPRLVKQIATATGAEPGGELYVESLSDAKGPASTYEKMFRYNVNQISAAMAKSS